jgi:hypothetical protein
MSFTDDDLKGLEEWVKNTEPNEDGYFIRQTFFDKMMFFIKRLAAAEKAKRAHDGVDDCPCNHCNDWRKAAGK